jgi:transcriptional regulator with XRE-family HTH domain
MRKKNPPRRDNPDPIDIHVGGRLRLRRNLVGMSQEQLGKASGLTFQQIQKYERGANRMGASRLFQLARILEIDVSWFFGDLPAKMGAESAAVPPLENPDHLQPKVTETDTRILQRRETLEVIRAYYRILDPRQRRKIYELIKSMSEVKVA